MFRKLIKRIYQMKDITHFVVLSGLKLSCMLLFLAVVFLNVGGAFCIATYELHYCAAEIIRSVSGILLLIAIGSVCIEDAIAN